jgi:hypothetical protein
MNHKRKRPKNKRAGCLLCKPHKANGADRRTFQEKRQDEKEERNNRAHSEMEIISLS